MARLYFCTSTGRFEESPTDDFPLVSEQLPPGVIVERYTAHRLGDYSTDGEAGRQERLSDEDKWGR